MLYSETSAEAQRMPEKNLEIGVLLDFYGDVLSERKRLLLDLYYNNDYSLSEISEEVGITRQGVLDTIKKGKEDLIFFEEKLRLYGKFKIASEKSEKLLSLIKDDETVLPEIKKEIIALADALKA